MHIKKKFNNLLYYMVFAIYVPFSLFSSFTMLGKQSELIQSITKYVYFLCLVTIIIKMILDCTYNYKHLLFIFLICVLALLIYLKTGYTTIIIMFLFIFGANNCSSKIISKIHFYSGIIVLALAAYSVFSGIVPNTISVRASGKIRHSFGMTMAPVFPMILAFVVMDFLYIKKRSKFVSLPIIIATSLFSSIYFDARLESLSFVALAVILLFYERVMKSKVIRYICIYSFIICAVIAFLSVYLYMAFPGKFSALNFLLSNRLSLSAEVISDHNYTLLGSSFRMQGWGTLDYDWDFGYYYIDSSYINYTFRFGIIFIVSFGCFVTYMLSKIYKFENYSLILFVVFSSIYGIIITSSFAPYVCPFYIILYAKFMEKNDTKNILKGKKYSFKKQRGEKKNGRHNYISLRI